MTHLKRLLVAVAALGVAACDGQLVVAVGADGQPVAPPVSCEAQPARASPARLQRLTAAQYRATIGALYAGRAQTAGAVLTAPVEFAAPFATLDAQHAFTAQSGGASLSPFDVDDAWAAAEVIATDFVTRLAKQADHCVAKTPADDGCVRAVLGPALERLWSRPASAEELESLVTEVREARAELDAVAALVVGLRMALSSPEFHFRSELGAAGHLTSWEVAAALAAQLTDAPPDVVLWSAAQADALKTPEALRAQVRRLTASPERSAFLRRFLREYLRYDATETLFKDPAKFPWHRPAALVDDTERVVAQLVTEHGRSGLLRALLTSDLAWVRRDTRLSWGLSGDAPAEGAFRREPSRVGVLTHPSWLSGFSENDHNHLVRRGRFIRERLLCGVVPNLPIGVVPGVEQTPGLSFRQRVERHSSDPACWACHRLMDPLGYALEAWDHTGRPQTTDHDAGVTTSGLLEGAGAADGPYQDARALMHRLADAPEVQACWVRHLFTAALGRAPTDDDRCELERLTRVYVESGEDTLAVLEALYATPGFLARALSGEPP